MRYLLLFFALCGCCCLGGVSAAIGAADPLPLAIVGPEKADQFTLVKLSASGVNADAAAVWDVSPDDAASVEELPGGRMIFTGPPGVYKIKLRLIRVKDGVALVETARHTVTIGCPTPPKPPTPEKPGPTFDPAGATVRLRHGNSGCTATLVSPRLASGAWQAVTASHCTGGVGSVVTLMLKDGRATDAKVVARDTSADISWLQSVRTDLDGAACAKLADVDPAHGVDVWHNGYGIDKPGNREEGTVDHGPNGQGLLQITLSVSPGDSGGGIFRVDNGELVAVVSATTAFARKATMFGGAASAARRLRPSSP